MKMKMPRFYRWGGGGVKYSWSFGWLTGQDDDLICVRPSIEDRIEAKMALSPVCTTRILAILAFVLKMILLRIDDNMGVS